MTKKFKKQFGDLPITQQILSGVGAVGGTLTILQFFNLGGLSIGVEQIVTKTPINLWTAGIGALLLVFIYLLIRK